MLIDDTRCKDKMKEDITFAMGGSECQVVRLMCIPKFSETHVAVMLSVISKLATNCISNNVDVDCVEAPYVCPIRKSVAEHIATLPATREDLVVELSHNACADDDHPMIMLSRGTNVGQTSNKRALKEHVLTFHGEAGT
ncbi:hypothetical protein Tco_0913983 [Tanacetum coccineum]